MPLSRRGRKFLIVVGCVLLVLTATSLICASIAMNRLYDKDPKEASLGFQTICFLAPALLSILSGVRQGTTLLGPALATNSVGIMLGIGGLTNSILSFIKRRRAYFSCPTESYSCSDEKTLMSLHLVLIIVFVAFIVVSSVASGFGCFKILSKRQESEQDRGMVMTRQQLSYLEQPGTTSNTNNGNDINTIENENENEYENDDMRVGELEKLINV
ncbi:uncharacterized protein LOC114526177 [Dendronephthya gigantea]|uniref:uncharacterized protein LOC114526177 n=1 Tax=Dendronephthya gigantea TaxID=151771 RepID=UPI0010696291|nr:uncharacterized protein LOC114526177 [Dendronephthya gigantea]